MSLTDWAAWHHEYDRAGTPLARRLGVVKRHIDRWLDETSPRPVSVVSVCAGDGRDLLEVLAARADSARVAARLVELEEENVTRAARTVERLQLCGVHVWQADAGVSDAYLGAVPADLVLLCGVLGNISDHDVQRVISSLAQLCSSEALVVWTRHRRLPDLTPQIRSWLSDGGFDEVGFAEPDDVVWSVGAHLFRGTPTALVPGRTWFRFVR